MLPNNNLSRFVLDGPADHYKFQFTHSPLKNVLHRMRIKREPALAEALKINLTGEFFKDLFWRVTRPGTDQKNANLFFKGEQGSGKSTDGRIVKTFIDATQAAYGIRPSPADYV